MEVFLVLFSAEQYGGIGFGIDNNLEMKARVKSDTGEAEIKKIKLLDGFGISGGYNMLADSFNLSTMSIYARSSLLIRSTSLQMHRSIHIKPIPLLDTGSINMLGKMLNLI